MVHILLVHCVYNYLDMETVKYIRVSTKDQNIDRQETDKYKQYVDVCSGKIAFKDRKEGKKLYSLAASGKIKTIKVHSIDRFGRDTLNILNTIQEFTDMGVCIESEKEAIKTCDNEGKQTPTARLLLSVMATLAQFEIEQKKERQMEGIARKKATGFYKLNAGRSKESSSDFINKDKSQRILKMLKKGGGINEIKRTLRGRGETASTDTIRKVRDTAQDLELLKRAKSNEEKLKEYFKEPTNYKDIFELHKGMENCEMTLTELEREFEIHKVDYKKLTKKGAEETNDIWTLIKFVRRYDEIIAKYDDNEKIGLARWQVNQRKDDEKMMKIPYINHLYENR